MTEDEKIGMFSVLVDTMRTTVACDVLRYRKVVKKGTGVIKDILHRRGSKKISLMCISTKERCWKVFNIKKDGTSNGVILANVLRGNYDNWEIVYALNFGGDDSSKTIDASNHNFVAC
jgi:hypothetical protein